MAYRFHVVQAGVITGKVSDAEGKPVVEERLNLMAVDSTNQHVRSQMLDFRTDDRGVYRIFGLPAGRYKVAVGQDSQMGAFVGGRGRRPYKLTFHPDVLIFAGANLKSRRRTLWPRHYVGRPLDDMLEWAISTRDRHHYQCTGCLSPGGESRLCHSNSFSFNQRGEFIMKF